MVSPGEFRIARMIRPGDRVIAARRHLQAEPVRSVREVPADTPAYNLLVNPGGTFIPGRHRGPQQGLLPARQPHLAG